MSLFIAMLAILFGAMLTLTAATALVLWLAIMGWRVVARRMLWQ